MVIVTREKMITQKFIGRCDADRTYIESFSQRVLGEAK